MSAGTRVVIPGTHKAGAHADSGMYADQMLMLLPEIGIAVLSSTLRHTFSGGGADITTTGGGCETAGGGGDAGTNFVGTGLQSTPTQGLFDPAKTAVLRSTGQTNST